MCDGGGAVGGGGIETTPYSFPVGSKAGWVPNGAESNSPIGSTPHRNAINICLKAGSNHLRSASRSLWMGKAIE